MFRNLAIAENKSNPDSDVNKKYTHIITWFSVAYIALQTVLIGSLVAVQDSFGLTIGWIMVIFLDLTLVIVDIVMTVVYIMTLFKQRMQQNSYKV